MRRMTLLMILVAAVGSLALAPALLVPGMAAADPPFDPPGGPPGGVVPHPPPIVGTFQVSPIAVPIGGKLTYQGFCGFSAEEVVPAIASEVDPAFEFVHFFSGFPMPTVTTTGPWGVFSVTVTIPATGNDPPGTPIAPGGYFAMVACSDADGQGTVLPPTFFEITASRGRGGDGRG
jgi:hypothetical protein